MHCRNLFALRKRCIRRSRLLHKELIGRFRVGRSIGILFSFAPRLATVFGELGSILAERSGTGGCQLKLSLGRGHRCVAHGLERGAIKFCHGFVVLLWAQRRAAADGSLASPRTCPRRQTGARRRPSRCEAARASTNKQFPVKKTVDIDYGIWYKAGGVPCRQVAFPLCRLRTVAIATCPRISPRKIRGLPRAVPSVRLTPPPMGVQNFHSKYSQSTLTTSDQLPPFALL